VASPVAHTLVGIALGHQLQPRGVASSGAWLAFSAAAACAADLDFAAGLLAGDVNGFHHGPSHSLGAAILFGLASALIWTPWCRQGLKVFVAGSVLYASHLALDAVCGNRYWVSGQTLAWPFASMRFTSDWYFFNGIHHGHPGDSVASILGALWSLHNLRTVALEALVLLPLVALSVFLRGRVRRDSRTRDPVRADPIRQEDTMELDTIQARLLRVEKENRWMKGLAVGGLLLVGLLSAKRWQSDYVDAKGVFLRDDHGRIRAALHFDKQGQQPYLIFYDAQGRERNVLGVDEHGRPLLGLLDEAEQPRLALRLGNDHRLGEGGTSADFDARDENRPLVALLDESQAARLVLSFSRHHLPIAAFLDGEQQRLVELGVNADGTAGVSLFGSAQDLAR